MSQPKFNRKTQRLQSRVQFIRGKLSKTKGGQLLTDEEADMLTDQDADDMIAMGTLEAVDREPEPALAGDQGGDQGGGAAEGDQAAGKRGGK